MLTLLIESLTENGAEVTILNPPPGGPDALLEVFVNGVTRKLAVERRGRAPYPGEISSFLERRYAIGAWGTPTLVAPFIPESTGRLLIPLGWSWADDQGNYDLALGKGLRFRHRNSTAARRPTALKRTLPQGSGGLAIIRFLISARPEVCPRVGELATLFGITHARASQVLNQLREMRLATNDDGWAADRDALLQRFLSEYRGPGGTETAFYSLDSQADVVESLLARIPGRGIGGPRVAVSADVGPDLIAPWRRPTAVILYLDDDVTLDVSGLTETDRASANVFLRAAADASVFGLPRAVTGTGDDDIPLADPVQMIWDLHDLGGEDRREAADHLSEWLLKRD